MSRVTLPHPHPSNQISQRKQVPLQVALNNFTLFKSFGYCYSNQPFCCLHIFLQSDSCFLQLCDFFFLKKIHDETANLLIKALFSIVKEKWHMWELITWGTESSKSSTKYAWRESGDHLLFPLEDEESLEKWEFPIWEIWDLRSLYMTKFWRWLICSLSALYILGSCCCCLCAALLKGGRGDAGVVLLQPLLPSPTSRLWKGEICLQPAPSAIPTGGTSSQQIPRSHWWLVSSQTMSLGITRSGQYPFASTYLEAKMFSYLFSWIGNTILWKVGFGMVLAGVHLIKAEGRVVWWIINTSEKGLEHRSNRFFKSYSFSSDNIAFCCVMMLPTSFIRRFQPAWKILLCWAIANKESSNLSLCVFKITIITFDKRDCWTSLLCRTLVICLENTNWLPGYSLKCRHLWGTNWKA